MNEQEEVVNDSFYFSNFKVKKVKRIKDKEGKEEKVLLYLESNDINIVNSMNQVIISSNTKIRKN